VTAPAGVAPPSLGATPPPAALPAPGAALRARVTGAVAFLTAIAVFVWVWFAYLPAFNSAHTAVEGVPVPPARFPAPPAPQGRLIFMVVDGLGWDEARDMAELAPLRARGVSRMLEVEFPSYTYPALTSLVTGVEPRDSGVRLNGDWEGALGLDSVPRLAGAAGVPVEVRSRGWKPFEELMRPPGGAVVLRGRLQRLLALRAEERAAAGTGRHDASAGTGPGGGDHSGATPAGAEARRALVLEYVEEVDQAGHDVGTRDPVYARARAFAGAVVARRLEGLDLERDTLVVVSDHGHRAAGGHGGVEPGVLRACFFAAGPSLQRGVELGSRPMRDVASTLALLSGLSNPATNTGRPMLDALRADASARARLLAGPLRQQASWLCALAAQARGAAAPARCAEVEPLARRLDAGDAGALAQGEELADALWTSRLEAEREREVPRRRQRQLAVAAVVALLAALVAWWARTDLARAGARAAWAPLLFLTLHCGLLLARGYRPTFSALPPMTDFVRDTFAAGALSAIITVLAAARGGGSLGVAIALLSVGALYALLAATVGSEPRVLPDPLLGVLAFHGAPAVLFASLASLAAALRALRHQRGDRAGDSPRRH
jgi:hypothetical protein